MLHCSDCAIVSVVGMRIREMDGQRRAGRQAKKKDAQELLATALKLLEMRAHSRGELRTKLQRRAATPEDLNTCMQRLDEMRLLNDDLFAESFARSRREGEAQGRQRVMRDLMNRQVSGPAARRAVEEVFAGTEETELIRDFLLRKYRSKDLGAWLAEEKNMASAFRRLRTSGYSAGASIRVLKQWNERAEEFESLPDEEAEANEA
jgi:regulatory protein